MKTNPIRQPDEALKQASEYAGHLLQRFPELRNDRKRTREVLREFRKALMPSMRAPGRPRRIQVDIAAEARQAGSQWKEIWPRLRITDRMEQLRIRDAVSKRTKNLHPKNPHE